MFMKQRLANVILEGIKHGIVTNGSGIALGEALVEAYERHDGRILPEGCIDAILDDLPSDNDVDEDLAVAIAAEILDILDRL